MNPPSLSNRPGASRLAVAIGVVLLSTFWIALTWKLLLAFVYDVGGGKVWGVADDVYISADFARTLAQGGGARWYPGAPRVEGFTSPLWMLIIAVLHLVPDLSGGRLGLSLFVLDAGIFIALAYLVVVSLLAVAAELAPARAVLFVGVPVAAACGASLCAWAANGFETPLVALLSVAAFREALRDEVPTRARRVGLLAAAAVWTRLDAVLYCFGALVLVTVPAPGRRPRPGSLEAPLIVALALSAQFAGRFAYYGEWLPNTYYLKATGWPLFDRTAQGWLQNAPAILPLLVSAPLAGFSLPRLPARAASRVAVPLLTCAGAVVYSTTLGGDFVFEDFGFDRFGSVGALFLAVGLPAFGFSTFPGTPPGRLAGGMLALAVGFAPVLLRPSLEDGRVHRRDLRINHLAGLNVPLRESDPLLLQVIRYGVTIGQITRPGARVAVCAAGAPIYFSFRAGIDLLGKVDKRVARLSVPRKAPPDARCWRGFPGAGHNKEDTRGTFRLEKPDLSVVRPPHLERHAYRQVEFDGDTLWARKKSPFVRWDLPGLTR